MTTALDIALRNLYLEFDTPADRVLSNPDLGDEFFLRVSDRVGMVLEKELVFKRLLYLRKRGQLPRLRRN